MQLSAWAQLLADSRAETPHPVAPIAICMPPRPISAKALIVTARAVITTLRLAVPIAMRIKNDAIALDFRSASGEYSGLLFNKACLIIFPNGNLRLSELVAV